MLNIGQNYWILKIVYWRVAMMTCLNIVVVNQMINRTGAVKLKKYNFKYGLSYVWLNQCGELIIEIERKNYW